MFELQARASAALAVAMGMGALACRGAPTDDAPASRSLRGVEEPLPVVAARTAFASDARIARLLAPSARGLGPSAHGAASLAAREPARAWAGELVAELPAVAAEPVEIGPGAPGRFHVRLVREGASRAPLVLHEGRASYADAWPGIDVVVAADSQRYEEILVVRDSRRSVHATWRCELPAGIRDVRPDAGGGLRFVDAKGEGVLRAPPAIAVDADGVRRGADLRFLAGALELDVDLRGLTPPVAIDPALEAVVWEDRQAFPGTAGRVYARTAYDSARGRTVLFGGESFSGGTTALFGDTWEWDGTSWVQRSTTGPSPRASFALAFDSKRGVTVLHGGANGTTVFGDTWEWNGTSWAQRASGPAFYEHAMAFDSARGVSVLLGAAPSVMETWEWNGVVWTQRTTGTPSWRTQHAVAYDSARSRTVVFGGFGGSSALDTEEWDGATWTQMCTAASCNLTYPSFRWDHAIAYDSVRKRTVLFGGDISGSGVGVYYDHWEWDGVQWAELPGGPPGRYGHAMAFDSQRGRVVFVGGTSGINDRTDTWELHTRGGGCATGSQCDTGSCVDGVCCDASACDTCDTCAGATPGVCTPITGAPDPDSCAGSKTCDTLGTCRLVAGQPCSSSAECATGSCADGFCCDAACDAPCDVCAASLGATANGVCSPATAGYVGAPACSLGLCPGNAITCGATCASDSACASGSYCSASGTCAPVKPQGASCDLAAGADCLVLGCRACQTSFCADGRCCGSACAGPCDTCSATPGTCTLTAAGASGAPSCAPFTCSGASAQCGTGCATDADCAAGSHCSAAGACRKPEADGTACAKPTDCASGYCADGVCCTTACNGACVACAASKKTAGPDGACGPALGGTDPHDSCAPAPPCGRDGACDGAGACRLSPKGLSCGAATACSGNFAVGQICDGLGACGFDAAGADCAPFVCRTSGCVTVCAGAIDCAPGAWCDQGVCRFQAALGAPCSQALGCASGHCTEGVCCTSDCDGVCQSCLGARTGSTDGACTFVADGVADLHCTDDGAPSCKRDGRCDGQGACRLYTAGAACAPDVCLADGVHAGRCDGVGTCVDAAVQACSPYGCAAGACVAWCTGESDCAADAHCSGGACEADRPLGQGCASALECASGFCADGVCCGSPCDHQCEACDVAGEAGTCLPVVGGPRGSRSACESAAGADACSARTCNGVVNDHCAGYVATETSCRKSSCADGVETRAATCNGAGICPELVEQSCGGYVCQGDHCGAAPCASDVDCAPKFRCAPPEGGAAHACVPRDTATCEDGHTVVGANGIDRTDCAPYRCTSDARCQSSCGSIDDCVAGAVCDSSGACIPRSSDAQAADSCGCRVPGRQPAGGGAIGVLASVLLALRLRRRRPWRLLALAAVAIGASAQLGCEGASVGESAGVSTGTSSAALETVVWESRTVQPEFAVQPSFSVAFDAKHGRAVTLKGYGASAETWTWDGAVWARVAVGGPGAGIMTWDATRERVLLFGGWASGAYTSDTWEWDGAQWTQRATTGPSVRTGAALAFDAPRGRAVLFGGYGASSLLSDTWEWDGSQWTQRASTGPAARLDHGLAFDTARGYTLLFGGRTTTSDTSAGDTWSWNGTAWTQRATTGATARFQHAMANDAGRGRVVVFGGYNGYTNLLGNTWEWDGTQWTQRATVGPSPRAQAALVYDTVLAKPLLVGGNVGGIGTRDSWTWNGTSWAAVGIIEPAAVPGLAFDSARGVVVAAAGRGAYGPFFDTYEWNGSAFSLRAVSGPAARADIHMAYDASRSRTVLFGGDAGLNGSPTADTWEWDGASWAQRVVAGPAARSDHTVVYDAARKRTLVFGGWGGSALLGDTWEYNGTTWTQRATTGPAVRRGHAMAYDVGRSRGVLFGGQLDSGGALLAGDTWEWDGTTWSKRSSTGPSIRYASAMAYDGARARVVLCGGYDGSKLTDTWEWDGTTWTRTDTGGLPPVTGRDLAYDGARKRIVSVGGPADVWEYHGYGGACSLTSQCDTASCTDGVCCEAAACGTCETCAGSSPGLCTPLTSAPDPGVCDGTKACDALGVCKLALGRPCASSGLCASGFCADGVCCDTACGAPCDACAQSLGATADGTCSAAAKGYAGSPACGAYVCPGGTSLCGTSCNGDASCAAAYYCAPGGACAPRKTLAAGCDTSAGKDCLVAGCRSCASGFCADGVCCDTACGGACDSCSATAGTCTLVAAGGPGSPSCAPYACSGTSGSCGAACISDAQCAAAAFCTAAGKCQADQPDGATCSSAAQCVSGHCVDGVCCDTDCTGACHACAASLKVSGVDGVCGFAGAGTDPHDSCAPDAPCGHDGTCNGLGGCRLAQKGVACGATTACTGTIAHGQICDGLGACEAAPGGVDCAPYACASGGCRNPCANDAECVAGFWCDGGACKAALAPATPCQHDAQCAPGRCVEGICCNTACDGVCQSCLAAKKGSGADGTCGFVASGGAHASCTDEGAPSCGHDGTCDGAGACNFYPAGAACAAGACVGGAPVAYGCNGTGACLGVLAPACAPFACWAGACTTGCLADDDCGDGARCAAGTCVSKDAAGSACASAGTCVSGFCADGVCCNVACDGQCEACDVPSAPGICVPVSGVPHAPRAACAAESSSDPCSAARCDGQERASCAGRVGPEVACRERSCSGGSETIAAACDGKGACPAEQTRSCVPYVCAGDRCGAAPCGADSDCSPDFRCAPVQGGASHDCIPRGAASCFDDHTVQSADGTQTIDCAPYRCEAAGVCRTDCNSVDGCVAPNVCDSNGRCVAPAAATGGAEPSGCGCRLAGAPRPSGPRLWALALIVLAWSSRRTASRRPVTRRSPTAFFQ